MTRSILALTWLVFAGISVHGQSLPYNSFRPPALPPVQTNHVPPPIQDASAASDKSDLAYVQPAAATYPSTSSQFGATGEHIEYKHVHKLEISYEYATVWPRGGPYTARLYLPVPPETGNEHITGFSPGFSGSIHSDRSQRRMLATNLEQNLGDDRYYRWEVDVVGYFRQRELVPGPPAPNTPVAPTPSADDLRSTESINWNTDRFQSWLQESGLVRSSSESSAQFGRRLFDYLENHGRYDYPPSAPWNASATCNRLSTDCGGFSLVFTAACRANNIPAHLLVGQWLKTAESGHTVQLLGRQPHVYAEFFDPQIGWIPADLSSALMHVPGYKFGSDPGYFLVWHLDTDFHLSTPSNRNEHVQWIQNPSPWFSPAAEAAASGSRHSWTIRGL